MIATLRRGMALGLALLALGSAARAQDEKAKADLAGVWSGTLKPGGGFELLIAMKVEKAERGGYKAQFSTPYQGSAVIDVETLEFKGGAVSFKLPNSGGSYAGTLSADGKTIEGQWTQGFSKLPLTFARTDPATLVPPEAPAEVAGFWAGKLTLPGGMQVRLVLRVEEKARGDKRRRIAVLDSPDQGTMGIPATRIKLDGSKVTVEFKGIGGRFEGTLDKGKKQLQGEWSQGGGKFPLTLSHIDKPTVMRRPQHPEAPFPYEVEQIAYRNEDAGVKFAGTLTRPKGKGPFPAVLLITGSGTQDRDETALGHKPFLVLADSLTRRGLAVLRADDRGVGGSTGSLATVTSVDLVGDVLAGVAFLKRQPRIDPTRIGLAGHSEGGTIAPMVAARDGSVAFLVLLAGSGVTGEKMLLDQNALILRAGGASEKVVKRQVETLGKLIDVIKAEPDEKALPEKLNAITRDLMANLTDEEKEAMGVAGSVEAAANMLASPWFRYFLTYDPRPTLTKVRCPVLAIDGELDLQVPPDENLAGIAKALEQGGNKQVTIAKRPGLNHLFQHAKTGSPSEYATIEETFDPETLAMIADWIEKVVARDH
jgi:pimeloyl-ACP methyl ester carboxylesterase